METVRYWGDRFIDFLHNTIGVSNENLLAIVLCFGVALVIVLLVNAVAKGMILRRQTRRIRELFQVNNVVTLRQDLLLSQSAVAAGRTGTITHVLDRPVHRIERGDYHKVAIVDFDGTLVPITVEQARVYLDLKRRK